MHGVIIANNTGLLSSNFLRDFTLTTKAKEIM